ncbi:Unidentified vitellogenin-linked transcript protein 5, isoform b, putative [Brugia malayi]|uniref:Bm9138 n=1 Tax=Brugia malayi TaxID=6279 RepID=A0A0H5S3X3_BRUMA|nr:Unidentified vitellogenin-linked transcript protein 5, isoform b, putative [Brugia malayi]CRZ23298.1 Bm9138 [Brugia malayi]VIP00422.1 Unidentified vitellogenin-linked transcript protein 5, isoform b, putative [Brugia malayi]
MIKGAVEYGEDKITGVSFDQSLPTTDEERMRVWEVGHPDYLGADAYSNIQEAIDHALE